LSAPETHNLAGIKILADLNEDQLRDFERSCRWRRFAPDEQIVDQQADSNDVYFITRGRVRVVNFTYSGKEVALEDLSEGQYFGELAAIDGRPRSSSVVAIEDSDIAKMTPERFIAVMKMYPDVGLNVMRNLASIIRTSTERIVDLSTLGANSRVHGELLRQAALSSSGDNSAIIKPIPVHSDMASRASTTRETVARVLSDLAKKGIVKREKDSLVICDVLALEDLVDEVRG
jgi:CRP/FNR family transcriptional regulator, cyclic AMP receptor protein